MSDNKHPVDRYFDERPNFGYWAGTVIGAVLTLVGCAVVFQLLTTPTEHMPNSEASTYCLPVTQWREVPEHHDVSYDRENSLTREHCSRKRENTIATAIFVAVPTSMVGSLTGAAILFRRRLTPHQQSSDQNGQVSE
ncbi:hypothetical protein [Nocardiopsis xinjiangensis]|uniref:hypothetical protein n=1 Tax=Nocardiopsis xinjiangensis TaxID=124285 RepID=UPI00034BFC22|nr:hypothetical protein [Nocardiopsis xinjiangensis]